MFFGNRDRKSFFDYFEDQSKEVYEAAQKLKGLFVNGNDKILVRKQIHEHEHAGDKLTRSVIMKMNTEGFILPIDHEDIFNLTERLDDVLDEIDDCSEAYAEIYLLDESTPFAQRLAENVLAGAKLLTLICNRLHYPSQHSKEVLDSCKQIHVIEMDSDVIHKQAQQAIFLQLKENDVKIAEYIAWKEIYNILEMIVDKIEDVSNVAEQIVTKYS